MKYFVSQCISCGSTILVSEDITQFCLENNISTCELLDNGCCRKMVRLSVETSPHYLWGALSGWESGIYWEVLLPYVILNEFLEDENRLDRWSFIAGSDC